MTLEAAAATTMMMTELHELDLLDNDDSGTSSCMMSMQLRDEAHNVLNTEPELSFLLHKTILAPGVETFEDAVVATVCFRLFAQNNSNNNNNNDCQTQQQQSSSSEGNDITDNHCCGSAAAAAAFSLAALRSLFQDAVKSDDDDILEMGWTLRQALRADAKAVVARDPAMNTLLQVVLFSKGYAALVCHRVAFRLWHKNKSPPKRFTALYLQSQCSAVWGVDIHPCARIGAAVLLDHGTGIVVGETACIGNGSTLLHNVTLGGTGKESGDRHPKVGEHVLIGCNSSILGNIVIGNCAKIGAGSVVLRSIPPYATAVGAPAKIIGRAAEMDPGSEIDFALRQVSALHKVPSSVTVSTTSSSTQPYSTAAFNTKMEDNSSKSSSLRPQYSRASSSSASSTNDNKNNVKNNDSHHHDNHHHHDHMDCSSWPKDDLCPFREYRHLAKLAPPGTITIITLAQILTPLGCTSCQVGACFFELDERHVGHVHYWHNNTSSSDALSLEEKVLQITAKYCPNMEPSAVRAALQRAQQDNQHFHLTDGTDQHRCCCEKSQSVV